jgi:hypothetical protein
MHFRQRLADLEVNIFGLLFLASSAVGRFEPGAAPSEKFPAVYPGLAGPGKIG